MCTKALIINHFPGYVLEGIYAKGTTVQDIYQGCQKIFMAGQAKFDSEH